MLLIAALAVTLALTPTSALGPSSSASTYFVPTLKHTSSSPALTPQIHSTSHTFGTLASTLQPRRIQTVQQTIQRRKSSAGRSIGGQIGSQVAFGLQGVGEGWDQEWEEVEVTAPDLSDMGTLVNLAKMANDAYAVPNEPRWMELDQYNLTLPFGWEESAQGLRGHVFSNSDNSTVIISIKGTSIDGPGLPRGGSTAKLDQLNDNLFFSCCCGTLPSSVCSCKAPFGGPLGRKKDKVCDEGCLTSGLLSGDSYYPAAIELYAQVMLLFPHAQFWVLGHSLGGVVASLLGTTFGLPTVTFESPADRMVLNRLGLAGESRRGSEVVTQVFHTGDMIATSQCRGPLSACGRGGYAMESTCKSGRLIVYETVEKWGWKVDRTGRSHTIQWVIDNVYSKPWNNGETEGPEGRGRDWTDVPLPTYESKDCVDCADWTFI